MSEEKETVTDETYESTYMISKKEYQKEIKTWIQEAEKNWRTCI